MHIFKNTTKYMLYNIFLGYVISTLQILNKKKRSTNSSYYELRQTDK